MLTDAQYEAKGIERIYEYTITIKTESGKIIKEVITGYSDEHATEEAEGLMGDGDIEMGDVIQVEKGPFLYWND